jgi:thioredoxin reductase (NADPH)
MPTSAQRTLRSSNASSYVRFHWKHSFVCKLLVHSPRTKSHPHSETDAILGDVRLNGVQLRGTSSGEKSSLKVANVFVMIVADPNTSWLKEHVEFDHHGFVETGRRDWGL